VSALRRLHRDECGQTFAFFALFLTMLLGLAALVIDVGSWYHEQRRLQKVTDAAALAGAFDLPVPSGDPSTATADAILYAGKNGAVDPADASNVPTVTYPTGGGSMCARFNDASVKAASKYSCIDVVATHPASGFFSRIYNLLELQEGTHSSAVSAVPASMKNIVPIAVKNTQEKLDPAKGCPCFNQTTRLNFSESELSSSSFGIVDLGCPGAGCSGGAGTKELENWINFGYSGYVAVNTVYPAVTGERIGPIKNTLVANEGKPLLYPVFDTADNATKTFHIVGWAAFVIDTPSDTGTTDGGVIEWKNDVPGCTPNCKVLQGHFVQLVTKGFWSAPGSSAPFDYGVRVIALVH
jgi:hypothetical protein